MDDMARVIKTSEEYANLVPPLSAEEYESLKESIRTNRLWVPIIVNNDRVILDGHHRFKACNELGIKQSEIKTTPKSFTDKLQETLFVIDCNLTRRQLNNFQKTELALKSKSILEQIAKQNESLGGKGKGDRILSPLGRVDEQIGRLAGVSRDTVQKVETLIQEAPERVRQSLRSGDISINHAFEDYRTGRMQEHAGKLTEGKKHRERIDEPEEIYNDMMNATGKIFERGFDYKGAPMPDIVDSRVIDASEKYRLRLLKGLGPMERKALIIQMECINMAAIGFLKHVRDFFSSRGKRK